jgi:hypothetical protein
MLKKTISILTTFLLVLFLASCHEELPTNPEINNSDISTLNKGKPLANASGSGHFANAPGEQRVFSHNAQMKTDGSVNGHFDLNNKGSGIHIGGSVFCLGVVGNIAYFGGMVENTNSTSAFWDEGSLIYWSTIDNGEGKNSSTDQITFVHSNLGLTKEQIEEWCANPIPAWLTSGYFDIERGNIQIR